MDAYQIWPSCIVTFELAANSGWPRFVPLPTLERRGLSKFARRGHSGSPPATDCRSLSFLPVYSVPIHFRFSLEHLNHGIRAFDSSITLPKF